MQDVNSKIKIIIWLRRTLDPVKVWPRWLPTPIHTLCAITIGLGLFITITSFHTIVRWIGLSLSICVAVWMARHPDGRE